MGHAPLLRPHAIRDCGARIEVHRIGVFVDFVTTGTVGPGVGGGSTAGGVTGVQLIR